MIRLTLAVSCAGLIAFQGADEQARALLWYARNLVAARRSEASITFDIGADTGRDTTHTHIAKAFRSAGLTIVPFASMPGPDTLAVFLTLPQLDSVTSDGRFYTLGIDSRRCASGRVVRSQAVIRFRCQRDACTDLTEEPVLAGDGGERCR